MSKIKLFLDVVEDMETLGQRLKAAADSFCHLACSVKTVAQALRENDSKQEALPAPTQQKAPAKEKPLTDVDVRAVLRPRIAVAGRDAVQDLLRKYGSPLLTEIDPVHYAALVADAKALVPDEDLPQQEETNGA